MAHSHEDIEVWKKGMDLVDAVYSLSAKLPASEHFGLISQLQRASVSIPANIDEGCGRETTKDLLRHRSIPKVLWLKSGLCC
jgi:four helix bundle protein